MKYLKKYNESITSWSYKLMQIFELHLEDNKQFEVVDVSSGNIGPFSDEGNNKEMYIIISEDFSNNEQCKSLIENFDDRRIKSLMRKDEFVYGRSDRTRELQEIVIRSNVALLTKISKMYDLVIEEIQINHSETNITPDNLSLIYHIKFYVKATNDEIFKTI